MRTSPYWFTIKERRMTHLCVCLGQCYLNQFSQQTCKVEIIMVYSMVSLTQYHWHLGLDYSLLLGTCLCRVLSSIPGLYPLDINSTPCCDNQKYLKTLPSIPLLGAWLPSLGTIVIKESKSPRQTHGQLVAVWDLNLGCCNPEPTLFHQYSQKWHEKNRRDW